MGLGSGVGRWRARWGAIRIALARTPRGVGRFVVTDPSADTAALERLIDYWTPLAVRALAEAGVFAAFGAEPHRVDEIADAVGVDAATLGRFLRTSAPPV